MTARRILYGYRDDLTLADRWWHRALFVLAIVVAIAVGGALSLVSSNGEVAAARTVEIQHTYFDFVKKSTTKDSPIFLISAYAESSYGNTVQCGTPRDADVSVNSFTSGADESFCAKSEFVYPALAEAVRIYGDKANVTRDGLLSSVWNQNYGVVCVISSSFPDCDLASLNTKTIVDHPISGVAWLRVFAWGVWASLVTLLIAANLYHRILLYVVFGKRRIAKSPQLSAP